MSQQYSKGDFIGMMLHSHLYYFLYRHSISGNGVGNLNIISEEFEKDLFKLVQELLETTQGDEGFIEVVVPGTQVILNALEYTENLIKYVRNNRGLFLDYQKAILDQMEIILSKLLYKLKYFK